MIWVSGWGSIEERYAHEEEMRDFQQRSDALELMSPGSRSRRLEGVRETEYERIQDQRVFTDSRLLKIKSIRRRQLERLGSFLDILDILIKHTTNPMGEARERNHAATAWRRQFFLYLAVAKREIMGQWDDVVVLYEVACRSQRVISVREGFRSRWTLNQVCVSLSRNEGLKDKIPFVHCISVGELICPLVEAFLGDNSVPNKQRNLQNAQRHDPTIFRACGSLHYLWKDQLRCRYVSYLSEQSREEKHKACEEALKSRSISLRRMFARTLAALPIDSA
jgi:hypothetical protein